MPWVCSKFASWAQLDQKVWANQGHTKDQLILKGFFGILNSPKKPSKKCNFTTMIPQVDLFSFVFWEKLQTPKRHFEINLSLVCFTEAGNQNKHSQKQYCSEGAIKLQFQKHLDI